MLFYNGYDKIKIIKDEEALVLLIIDVMDLIGGFIPDLDKYKNGKEIVYSITENTIVHYEVTVSGYDVTNTHAPETVSVFGTKVWNDADNQDGIRPESIVIRLFADGTEVAHKTVTAADGWKWNFTAFLLTLTQQMAQQALQR